MFHYQSYGLCVGVSRPLPALPQAPSSAPIDIHIDLEASDPLPEPLVPFALVHSGPELQPNNEPGVTLWQLRAPDASDYFQLRYIGGDRSYTFTLDSAGTRVWGGWAGQAQFTSVVTLILTQVLPVALWLRGVTCLHAGVVSMDGRAVVLLGSPGAGKSTMAAAFAGRGYRILADDIATLDDRGTEFWIQPAYPGISLWQNAAEAILGLDDLPRIWSSVDKRRLYLDTETNPGPYRFENLSLPLAAVYLLGPRRQTCTAPFIDRIAPVEAVPLLVANRFTRAYPFPEQRATEFDRFGRVARQVPIRRIYRPDDLASVPRVCNAIVEDVTRILDRAPLIRLNVPAPGGLLSSDA